MRDADQMMQLITVRGRQLIAGSGFAALRYDGRARWVVTAAADIESHRYAELHATFNQRSSVRPCAHGDTGRCDSSRPRTRPVHPDSRLARLGVSHIVVATLGVAGSVFGTFNWYLGDEVDDDVLDLAHLFARNASVAYLHARERSDLLASLRSQVLIAQAQGLVMARLGLGAGAAVIELRRRAQHGRVRLREVAAEIVRTGDVITEVSQSDCHLVVLDDLG